MAAPTVKTVWFSQLEAAAKKNAVYQPTNFSTLNEKFSVNSGDTLAIGEIPDINGLVIGRGGHRNVAGPNGASLSDTLQHRITDACLFEHLPWVMCEVGEDLDDAERRKYGLRRLENHDGVDYFVYYLKYIEVDNADSVIQREKVVDGELTIREYVPTSDQLDPTPVSMTNGEVNTSTGEHLTVTSKIVEAITPEDMTRIMDACEIIYSDRRFAEISEMAIVSSYPKMVTSNAGGVSVNYEEAIAAQCCSFLTSGYRLMDQTEAIDLNFSVGNSLPYLI